VILEARKIGEAIDRYVINSPMLPELKNLDGSLTLHIQKTRLGRLTVEKSEFLPLGRPNLACSKQRVILGAEATELPAWGLQRCATFTRKVTLSSGLGGSGPPCSAQMTA
jgi:hypothetical protein